MNARRMLELSLLSAFPAFAAIACVDAPDDQVGRTASSLSVFTPASELGIDDAVFRRVDTQPLVVCPPDSPFICRSQNDVGWTCNEVACAPSCEKIGCPGGWECVDLGAGSQCEPPSD